MHTSSQKERLIADILDNLQVNLKLTPKQVKQSFEFHKDQKRLNKYLEKSK
jgi:anthranilate phosphoribosyltransferase